MGVAPINSSVLHLSRVCLSALNSKLDFSGMSPYNCAAVRWRLPDGPNRLRVTLEQAVDIVHKVRLVPVFWTGGLTICWLGLMPPTVTSPRKVQLKDK